MFFSNCQTVNVCPLVLHRRSGLIYDFFTDSQVSKPIIENVQNALRIEGMDISITLSARWVKHYWVLLNNEYLHLKYVNGVKCLLQRTMFSIFGVFPTFIWCQLLNSFSNNSVLCFCVFLAVPSLKERTGFTL